MRGRSVYVRAARRWLSTVFRADLFAVYMAQHQLAAVADRWFASAPHAEGRAAAAVELRYAPPSRVRTAVDALCVRLDRPPHGGGGGGGGGGLSVDAIESAVRSAMGLALDSFALVQIGHSGAGRVSSDGRVRWLTEWAVLSVLTLVMQTAAH